MITEASKGAEKLITAPHAPGYGEVRIGAGHPFLLPRFLTPLPVDLNGRNEKSPDKAQDSATKYTSSPLAHPVEGRPFVLTTTIPDLLSIGRFEAGFGMGNSYMSRRASLENSTNQKIIDPKNDKERNVHEPNLRIRHLFAQVDQDPELKQVSKTPDSINNPDGLRVTIEADGEEVNPDTSKLMEHQVQLDMEGMFLHRSIRWQTPSGKILCTDSTISLLAEEPHQAIMRYAVTPENWSGNLTISSVIDNTVNNNDAKYLQTGKRWVDGDGTTVLTADTIHPRRTFPEQVQVATATKNSLRHSDPETPIQTLFSTEHPDQLAQIFQTRVQPGNTVTLEKRTALFTNRDKNSDGTFISDPAAASIAEISDNRTFDQLASTQQEVWQKIWKRNRVTVTGSPFIEQLQPVIDWTEGSLAMLVTDDNRFIAPAKENHIKGEGYRAHGFWDAKDNIKHYLRTDPDAARQTIDYLYNDLPYAAIRATQYKFIKDGEEGHAKGKLYGWELTDERTVNDTPRWCKDEFGDLVEIHSANKEIHNNAVLSWMAWQYWLYTNDKETLPKIAEIIASTAQFYDSIAQKGEDGKHHINDVVSPNEYHEGVDDDAFTNGMAAWNLGKGRAMVKLFPELKAKMGIADADLNHWQEVEDTLNIPFDPINGVTEEHGGYMKLERIDYQKLFPGQTNGDVALKSKGIDKSAIQITKQAAVVALGVINPGGILTVEQRRKNFEYYSHPDITPHGSSLSDGAHAHEVAELGDEAQLKVFMQKNANIDWRNSKGNGRDGKHTAGMGQLDELWTEHIGGFKVKENPNGVGELNLEPNLPGDVTSLEFSGTFHGNVFEVKENHQIIQVNVPPSADPTATGRVEFKVKNIKHTLQPGRTARYHYTTGLALIDPIKDFPDIDESVAA